MTHFSKFLLAAIAVCYPIIEATSATNTFLRKKEKKVEAPAISEYQKLTGRDSVSFKGVANVFKKDNEYYLELPIQLMGREFLVTNRLQRVPLELNEAGVNKGINYENQTISFQWCKEEKVVHIRQQRRLPEVHAADMMRPSVEDNYINPILASLKIENMPSDSSSVVVKITNLFNGKETSINDVFNNINLGTSAKSDLSRIISIKAFEKNIVALSELTTTVHEGMSKVNITVVVSSSLTLLPEVPMAGRHENHRIGYFTTNRLHYSDIQQKIKNHNYITRWRLEPSDTAAYLRGELTNPVQPITFYIDPSTPEHLAPYIKKGILDWNKAFEKAGFKEAIQVKEYTDSIASIGDDMAQSVFTYAASAKANAMGPSVIDPRTGEILEADIIWWHNVVSLLREWIIVQTAATNPEARTMNLPEHLLGDAARFVACHEVGHSLGLKHNMIASWTYPTDSLRSSSFMNSVKGTASSIMDYARFNYVAQPEDHVAPVSPQIGPYDLLAIEWGYRWYPDIYTEKEALQQLLDHHTETIYKYGEEQSARTAVDPRSLSEALGDNAMKSSAYGIQNLKRIMPHIIEWTTSGEMGQTYEDAADLYSGVIYQWGLYVYHVMANIGGIYLEPTEVGDGQKTYTFVEKTLQKEALEFLLDEFITYPAWLFNTSISDYTYILKDTPMGTLEQNPNALYKNTLNYLLWDLLDNERMVRMFENELRNGTKAFTAVEMLDIMHQHIFKTTLTNQNTDVMTRNMQKAFVDALITAAAETEGVKINKRLYDNHPILNLAPSCSCSVSHDENKNARLIDMYSTQINRLSDAISVKRGELIRILKLLQGKRNQADLGTRYHYEDLILRIQTALGLAK